MTFIYKSISLLVLIMFCIACSKQPLLTPIPQNGVILAFGDSLTQGVGTSPQFSYPSVLAQLTGKEVINAGISGNTSEQGLQRLPEALAQYEPNLVILCLGGNDVLRKIPSSITEQNLKQMIALIKGSGAQVVLVAVPDMKLSLRVPEYYEQIAEQYQIPLDKDSLRDLLKQRKYKSDSIHLNKDGYGQLAANLNALLRNTGAVNN